MTTVLNHTIELGDKEDYSKIGNSRIGGNPDLPSTMAYPIFHNGFYEFIIQINLKDHPITGLPNEGLFSIFYGSLDNNEAIAYYFEESETLENKEVPSELPFAGVTDFYDHNSHKIALTKKILRPREELPQYNDPQYDEEDNIMHWRIDFLSDNSFFMHRGIQDKSHIYLKSQGFNRLIYGYGIWLDDLTNSLHYRGRDSRKNYSSVNDLKTCELTMPYLKKNMEVYQEWLTQIDKFESEKEFHIERFKEYKCIFSLDSLTETGMVWGDSHKLEFFGFESDLKNKIIKLNSTIP